MTRPEPRIAVAGAGLIGRRHIEVAMQLSRGRLCAIVDPSPSAADLARELSVPHYTELSPLLSDRVADGVVLATPNKLHVDNALECIAAGLPALVEKPVAHSVQAGLQLCEASEAAGVPILVGHHRRHSSVMAKAVELIQSGAIGKPVAIVGTALFYKAENEGYFDGANAWRRQSGGGPILLNLIHEIGNLRSLCGEVVSVQAFTSDATRGFEVEDTASISLRFAEGALGTFLLSDCSASSRSWEQTSGEDPRYAHSHVDDEDCYHVAGTMGSLSIPTMRLNRYDGEAARSWHRPMQTTKVSLEPSDPLVRQMEHFVDVIDGKAQPFVSARDGLQNLRVVEAILDSARSGRAVAL